MTIRPYILAAGLWVAAMMCFMPPKYEMHNPDYKPFSQLPRIVEVVDRDALALRILGVLAVTAALYAVAGGKRGPRIIDADVSDRAVR